eukprot:scaffold513310_cov32-Prasinocladus_malaysianus.AAC.1
MEVPPHVSGVAMAVASFASYVSALLSKLLSGSPVLVRSPHRSFLGQRLSKMAHCIVLPINTPNARCPEIPVVGIPEGLACTCQFFLLTCCHSIGLQNSKSQQAEGSNSYDQGQGLAAKACMGFTWHI